MPDKYIVYGKGHDPEFGNHPRITLGKFIWDNLIHHDPDSIAEINGLSEEKVTIGEIIDQGKALSKAFSDLGCGVDDIVLVICGNELAFTPCLLGCLWNGNPCGPVYNGFPMEDYVNFLVNYNPKVIVVRKDIYQKIKQAYQLTPYQSAQFIVIGNKEANEDFENSLYLSDLWKRSVKSFKPFELPEEELQKHCCLILPSSGTTGLPKGVRHTDKSFLYGIYYMYKSFMIKSPMISLTGGFWVSGVLSRLCALSSNLPNVLLDFDCESYLKCIEKYKIEFLIITPGYFGALMKYDNWNSYDISSLKIIFTGGGSIPDEILKIAEKKLKNVRTQNGYGMTEAMPLFTIFSGSIPPKGSIGQLFPRTMAKIICPETGRSLPANQPGELCIKTETLMQGYHNNPEATAEAIDKEGFMHTGDMVYYDENEFFYIVDRIKQLIKYQSHHVNANQIENVIYNLNGVNEVCVVGIPHALDWEHAKAFVVPSPNSKLTEEQIINHVTEHLPRYKWLHDGVQFVDYLPKTPSGKLIRTQIKKMNQV